MASHGIVSIHAPAWGATVQGQGRRRPTVSVSIHAPAWGATHTSPRSKGGCESFNPRPRVGGDEEAGGGLVRLVEFQSTPPRGGRPGMMAAWARSYSMFQSTPPRGGRPGGCGWRVLVHHVSIHAPAWGATCDK